MFDLQIHILISKSKSDQLIIRCINRSASQKFDQQIYRDKVKRKKKCEKPENIRKWTPDPKYQPIFI